MQAHKHYISESKNLSPWLLAPTPAKTPLFKSHVTVGTFGLSDLAILARGIENMILVRYCLVQLPTCPSADIKSSILINFNQGSHIND